MESKLTDVELVEAVAREVLKFGSDWRLTTIGQDEEPCMVWEQHRAYEGRTYWRPKSNLNDLFMVLEKFDGWNISKDWEFGYTCAIWKNGRQFSVTARKSLSRSVLEAVLMAERSEK